MDKHLVAPSLLASNFANLQKDIEMVNESLADWFHLDIMDGVFVPNISFGFPVIKHIKKYAQKPLDVHLMIVDPDRYITKSRDAGADILNVHLEACTHLHRTIQLIKATGMKPAVTLNPHTSVSLLKDILPELYMVLIMSVNPGYGGQKFIPRSYDRIVELKRMIRDENPEVLIEIDGGVDLSNAATLVTKGVDVLVAGSTVFKAKDQKQMIADLKHCI